MLFICMGRASGMLPAMFAFFPKNFIAAYFPNMKVKMVFVKVAGKQSLCYEWPK
jgi:hypothetical protein